MNLHGQMQGSGSSFEPFGSNRYGGESGAGNGEKSLWKQRNQVRFLRIYSEQLFFSFI